MELNVFIPETAVFSDVLPDMSCRVDFGRIRGLK
jgi:hypothetical protein